MPEHDMITVTAFKWVPPFAAGQVRDHRVRWMLNEIGWDYEIDLIDPTVQTSSAYHAEQPFGQVPVLRETGRPAVFESGAIVLDLEGVNFNDSQGAAKVTEIRELAEADGVTLRLARVKPRVLAVLEADGTLNEHPAFSIRD